MQNDMLKNTIAPWQEKGRWYHGLWDFSTNSFSECDKFITDHCDIAIQSNVASIYVKDHIGEIADVKEILREPLTIASSTNLAFDNIRMTTLGYMGRIIASTVPTAGEMDVYVFIVFKK